MASHTKFRLVPQQSLQELAKISEVRHIYPKVRTDRKARNMRPTRTIARRLGLEQVTALDKLRQTYCYHALKRGVVQVVDSTRLVIARCGTEFTESAVDGSALVVHEATKILIPLVSRSMP